MPNDRIDMKVFLLIIWLLYEYPIRMFIGMNVIYKVLYAKILLSKSNKKQIDAKQIIEKVILYNRKTLKFGVFSPLKYNLYVIIIYGI